MAQRKSGPAGRSGPAKSTSSGNRPTAAKSAAGRSGTTTAAKRGSAGRPPAKKPGKSIVNQKQTPWGLVAATVAVVLFAAAIVIVVVATHKSKKATPKLADATNTSNCTKMIGTNKTSYLNELQCAQQIKGVTFKPEANRSHVTTIVKYDSSPPVGGNHNQYWANCNGNVYDHQLANENAVHMLEHGAIWITYNPSEISGASLDRLKKYVEGQDRMALTPYVGLKTPFSLQAWGYQLFLSNPADPRVARFIKVLRYNKETTPEYGASCTDPYFDASRSTPGHPQNDPKT